MVIRASRVEVGKWSMTAVLLVVAALWATVAQPRVNEDLIKSARCGDQTKVKNLLSNGAEVNAKDKNGVTALLLASQNGHREVVEILLAKGAEVNAKEKKYGFTPLMLAAQNGHRGVVEVLLGKGAEVNVRSQDSSTALMAASGEGHQKIVEALLTKGAEVLLVPKLRLGNFFVTQALLGDLSYGEILLSSKLLAKRELGGQGGSQAGAWEPGGKGGRRGAFPPYRFNASGPRRLFCSRKL